MNITNNKERQKAKRQIISIITVIFIILFFLCAFACAGTDSTIPARTQKSTAFSHASHLSQTPVLSWKHGTSKSAALELLKTELQLTGYARYVRWNGFEITSKVTRLFFKIIDARGRITDDAVIIDRCRGMASKTVLKRCEETLRRLFPGGGYK